MRRHRSISRRLISIVGAALVAIVLILQMERGVRLGTPIQVSLPEITTSLSPAHPGLESLVESEAQILTVIMGGYVDQIFGNFLASLCRLDLAHRLIVVTDDQPTVQRWLTDINRSCAFRPHPWPQVLGFENFTLTRPASLGALWRSRMRITLQLLSRNVSFLLTDNDIVFLKDPFAYFNEPDSGGRLFDYQAGTGEFPPDLSARYGGTPNGGFAHFRATSATRALVSRALELGDDDDQRSYSRILIGTDDYGPVETKATNEWGGRSVVGGAAVGPALRWRLLDTFLFPTGKCSRWREVFGGSVQIHPFVIHPNCVTKEVDSKSNFLKRERYWLLPLFASTNQTGVTASPLRLQRSRMWAEDWVNFFHIPKTAGSAITSVLRSLRGCQPPGSCGPYQGNRSRIIYGTEKGCNILSCVGHQNWQSFRADTARIQKTSAAQTATPVVFSVTMLRHPVALFVSNFEYGRREVAAQRSPVFLPSALVKGLTPKTGNLTSVDAFLRDSAINTRTDCCGAVANRQVTMLTSDQPHLSSLAALALAKERLLSFSVFGVAEEYELTVRQFHSFFAADVRAFEPGAVFARQISSHVSDGLAGLRSELGEERWSAIERANNLDLELYRWALELFHTRASGVPRTWPLAAGETLPMD